MSFSVIRDNNLRDPNTNSVINKDGNTIETVSVFGASDRFPDNVFFRKKSDTNLYTKDKNGLEFPVMIGQYNELVDEDKFCNGAGIDGSICRSFINCIKGNGIQECKAFLNSAKFVSDAVDEVNNLEVNDALNFLKKLEFKEVTYEVTVGERYNAIKYELKKMQEVHDWLNTLKEKSMNKSDIEAIQKNKNLISYLKLVVRKINSSPGILNPGFVSSESSVGKLASNRSLETMGLTPKPKRVSFSSDINRTTYLIDADTQRLRGQLRIGYMGSNGITRNNYRDYYVNDAQLTNAGSILENEYASINARLEANNKHISDADNKKIVEIIKSLKNNEQTLNNFIVNTNKYIKLMTTYGERDGSREINLEDMKKFVESREKLFNKVASKRTNITDILITILDAIQKQKH
jgi:hypothetical protein